MNNKKRLQRALLIALAVCLIFVLLTLVAVLLIKWSAAPHKISFTEEYKTDIQAHLGVTVPDEIIFIEGYHYAGIDPTDVFIFKLPKPQNENSGNTEEYIRQRLALNDEEHRTAVKEKGTYDSYLKDLGYTFTHTIKTHQPFSYICYCVIDEDIYIALIRSY